MNVDPRGFYINEQGVVAPKQTVFNGGAVKHENVMKVLKEKRNEWESKYGNFPSKKEYNKNNYLQATAHRLIPEYPRYHNIYSSLLPKKKYKVRKEENEIIYEEVNNNTEGGKRRKTRRAWSRKNKKANRKANRKATRRNRRR